MSISKVNANIHKIFYILVHVKLNKKKTINNEVNNNWNIEITLLYLAI